MSSRTGKETLHRPEKWIVGLNVGQLDSSYILSLIVYPENGMAKKKASLVGPKPKT